MHCALRTRYHKYHIPYTSASVCQSGISPSSILSICRQSAATAAAAFATLSGSVSTLLSPQIPAF